MQVRLNCLAVSLVFFCLRVINLRADDVRSADQTEAYQALLSQYPLTVEKAFKDEKQRKYWSDFVKADDPIHVRIARISSNFEGQLSGGSKARVIFKADGVPPNPDPWWRIEVYGEMTPSVNSLIIYISTTSKKIVLAYYQPGE